MGALFGGGQKAAPVAEKPVVQMPDENDPAILAEKRRVREAAQARSGRASTLLSGDGDYGSDTLGKA